MPTVTSLNPAYGVTTGGTTVHVIGTGFTVDTQITEFSTSQGTGSGLSYHPPSEVVYVSATELTFVTAAGAGVKNIRLYDGGYSAWLVGAFEFTDTPPGPPALVFTSITPNHASINGGTETTMVGTGFLEDDLLVLFGAEQVVATVTDATHATVTTPEHAEGLVGLTLHRTSDNTTIVANNAFTFVTPVPAIPSPLGNEGDYYVDLADPGAPIFYGPKTDGDWGEPT